MSHVNAMSHTEGVEIIHIWIIIANTFDMVE